MAVQQIDRGEIRKPVFVVGCGRSGTTLLFDILSTHPGFSRTTGYPDGEDHAGWIEHGKCVMAGIGNVYDSRYGSGINGQQFCLHMTREDVTPAIVEAMHAYYWNDVLGTKKEQRVLNKQPHLTNKLDYLLAIFPDAKVVHIVRDCQAMVASWLAVMADHPALIAYWPKHEEFPCFWLMPKPQDSTALARLMRHPQFYPGGGSKMWIDYWCETNYGVEKQLRGREAQLLTVRYEDLIGKSVAVLDRIMDFCELPRFGFKLDHLDKNTAQKHRKLMSPDIEQAIREQTGPVQRLFAYQPGGQTARSLFQP